MRKLLGGYLDQRVLFYTTHDEQGLRQISARTVQLQDVLNAQGYTQAAFWNRIPAAAWGLMGAIAICCNLLFGYGLRSNAGAKLLVVLPTVISIAFMLVADIDTPRHGIIRVSPQNLISLSESLRAQ